MKTYFTILFILLSVCYAHSQIVTPEWVVEKIPGLPEKVFVDSVKNQYVEIIDELISKISPEILKRKKENEKRVQGFDKDAAMNMGAEQGFSMSAEDMQRLKSKKMSKEEKMEMASRMMQQSQNMSIEEVQKVSKMSKPAQAAYGEAVMTEKMAESPQNIQRGQANNLKNLDRAQMAEEQSVISRRIQDSEISFEEKVKMAADAKQNALKNYGICVGRVKSEYDAKPNTTLGDTYAGEIKRAMHQCFIGYCNNVSPAYKKVMAEQLAKIKSLANDYSRLEEIQAQLSQSIGGKEKYGQNSGVLYLETLKKHLIFCKSVVEVDIYRDAVETKTKVIQEMDEARRKKQMQ